MHIPTLDIVIVDYNAGEWVQGCLRSVAEEPPRSCALSRVVVVDNDPATAPTDYDVDLPLLEVIRNASNRGFAAACNQGARESQADYLLFLNPDTRLLDGSLDAPVAALESDPGLGVCGVQLVDEDGQPSPSCSRFPRASHFLWKMVGLQGWASRRGWSSTMIEWDHSVGRDVDVVMGAFLMVRRELFERLGGFDERFFVYFEETDLSLRVRQEGYRSRFLADARAFHKAGGASDKVRAARLFYSVRSRLLYAYKHFGWWSATGLALASLVLEPVSRCALALARGSGADLRETLGGYRMLWCDLPHWVSCIVRRAREDRLARRTACAPQAREVR